MWLQNCPLWQIKIQFTYQNGQVIQVNFLPKTRSLARASNTLEPPIALLKAADHVAVMRPTAMLGGKTLIPAIKR